jgi:hypothetical protein
MADYEHVAAIQTRIEGISVSQQLDLQQASKHCRRGFGGSHGSFPESPIRNTASC